MMAGQPCSALECPMSHLFRSLICALLLSLPALTASASEPETLIHGETSEQRAQRMRWFADAKLGIFIHWGIYAVDGVDESWAFFNA